LERALKTFVRETEARNESELPGDAIRTLSVYETDAQTPSLDGNIDEPGAELNQSGSETGVEQQVPAENPASPDSVETGNLLAPTSAPDETLPGDGDVFNQNKDAPVAPSPPSR
jgi:hypothetical protein